MKSILPLSLILFCCFGQLKAQESGKSTSQSIALKTQFFQVKDAFNYGLVFNGLNLGCEYSIQKTTAENTLRYSPSLAFGPNYDTGLGLSWHFKPVDFFYGYRINQNGSVPITIGPYFATQYSWQLYPELQSGHMLWFSSIEVGPEIMLTLPVKNKPLKITFSNAFAGWTSRPEVETETYFYFLGLSDFIQNAHTNGKFGFNNLFNHTNLEIETPRKPGKRLSLAYEFEYAGYYKAPKFSFLTHSINLKWQIGKKPESK